MCKYHIQEIFTSRQSVGKGHPFRTFRPPGTDANWLEYRLQSPLRVTPRGILSVRLFEFDHLTYFLFLYASARLVNNVSIGKPDFH